MKLIPPTLIFLITYIVRSYNIEKGKFVIWDEAHFGKFSERYLSRSFYFDVHPPLGKMLTALSGYIYKQPTENNFEFKGDYPENFDYAGMRRFHALISSFTPVFSYFILKEMKYNFKKRFLLSFIFVFENGFTSIGRLILLDSHLLTCTAAVVYFLTRLYFRNFKLIDLFLLGVSLGLVISVKWIGFFTTCLVGILIIFRLWTLLNSDKPFTIFLYEFLKNAICLIVIPILIYVSLFYLHFRIVNKSSSDEGHLSSFFQATLEGNTHIKNRKFVAYGTRITIKSILHGGGYLHSHNNVYPNFDENQVTTYTHKDNNNNWVLQKVSNDTKEALFVEDGEEVVLYHLESETYINVNPKKAFLSEGLLVSAAKKTLTHDNVFKIEIVEDNNKQEKKVKSLTTKFRLKHTNTNFYLKRTSKSYPEWGFQQGEVICASGIDEGTIWIVEENISDKIPEDVNPFYEDIYKNIFIKNFIEHNILMYKMNKSFVQDDSLEPDRIISKPYEWPLLLRGIRMSNWEKNRIKFYMFGNPFLWYISTFCVFLAPLIFLLKFIRYKRKICKFKNIKVEAFEVFLGLCGWICHYFPFYFVGRVLYFHHYYPALFFALISVCYVFKHLRILHLKIFIGNVIYFYFLYSKLTYGFIEYEFLKKISIIKTWDFLD